MLCTDFEYGYPDAMKTPPPYAPDNIMIIKLMLKNIHVIKFSRLEANPRKQRNYFA